MYVVSSRRQVASHWGSVGRGWANIAPKTTMSCGVAPGRNVPSATPRSMIRGADGPGRARGEMWAAGQGQDKVVALADCGVNKATQTVSWRSTFVVGLASIGEHLLE